MGFVSVRPEMRKSKGSGLRCGPVTQWPLFLQLIPPPRHGSRASHMLAGALGPLCGGEECPLQASGLNCKAEGQRST